MDSRTCFLSFGTLLGLSLIHIFTTGKELEGAKLQILNKDCGVLEEWVTEGKPHRVEKLPVGEELILREITAPEGYEIAEDVKFTLEDTMEVQKVEMKDARTPETPGVPPKNPVVAYNSNLYFLS